MVTSSTVHIHLPICSDCTHFILSQQLYSFTEFWNIICYVIMKPLHLICYYFTSYLLKHFLSFFFDIPCDVYFAVTTCPFLALRGRARDNGNQLWYLSLSFSLIYARTNSIIKIIVFLKLKLVHAFLKATIGYAFLFTRNHTNIRQNTPIHATDIRTNRKTVFIILTFNNVCNINSTVYLKSGAMYNVHDKRQWQDTREAFWWSHKRCKLISV